jgi:hypothetical protein
VRVNQDGGALHAGNFSVGDLSRWRSERESGDTSGRKELSKKRWH